MAEAAAGGAADASVVAASAPAAAEPAKPVVPAGTPMLAYTYNYGLRAPPKGVRALIAQHEAACRQAGAQVCQVVNSSVREQGEDQVEGSLALRATPAWLTRFRQGLGAEAKNAGGRVFQANVLSEDLSREIVDTEAMLRARTTLRDRLQNLLATRPGKLADLIELERELARVQGELDAAQSELAVMRQRVATSEVTITYESQGVLAPEGVGAPLAEAFGDFMGIIVYTLAAMVRLVAWLAPWVLVGGVVTWFFRKRLRRVFARKQPETPAS